MVDVLTSQKVNPFLLNKGEACVQAEMFAKEVVPLEDILMLTLP